MVRTLHNGRGASICHLAAAWLVTAGAGWSCAEAQPIVFELDEEQGWVQTDAPEPGTDEAFIAEARRLIVEGSPGRAESRLRDWLSEHEGTGNPWVPEARLLLGDAILAGGNEYKALFEYERVITRHADSPAYVAAIRRELDIAIRYANGLRRKILFGTVRWGGTGALAQDLLIRVQERMPGSVLGERAMIELADYYYDQREMSMASTAYDLFLANYPESEHRQRALLRRVLSNIAQFKGPKHDASGLREAELLIDEFRLRYPVDAQRTGLNESLLARLDESLGAQMLATSQWYLLRGDEAGARYVLRRLVIQHPRTVAATRARELLDEIGVTLAPAELASLPPRPGGIPPLIGDTGDGSNTPGVEAGPAQPESR